MQGHLKTFLFHREPGHKEGFINDPESPAMLPVALLNWTIVRRAFAARAGLFIMCLALVVRVYYRFIMFGSFVLRNSGQDLTLLRVTITFNGYLLFNGK